MSKLIVDVCAVEEIAVHPSADRIERVRVKNWWCIAGKGQYKVGDKVLYVPPDAVLPEALAERWGIAKYCCQLGKVNGERPPGLRVKACRFRGVSSFGTIQNLDYPTLEIGTDLQEHYCITKYEPPLKSTDGDADIPISAFHTYTSIEALGNFPNMLNVGEEVIVTEKIHGCFRGKTLITMANGERKKIKDIQAGELVFGTDASGKVVPSRVLKVWNHGITDKKWLMIRGTRTGIGKGNHFFSLHCTDNHEFFDPSISSYKSAAKFEINDQVLMLRNELTLSPYQEQVLIGKMLGDGTLHIANESASVEWNHSNYKYTEWVDSVVGHIGRNSFDTQISGHGSEMRRGGTTFLWQIREKFSSFIKDGKKIVPDWVADQLSPVSLAFWYMDDGSLGHHESQEDRVLLAICGFTKSDADILQKGLQRLGIISEYYEAEGYPRLRLNADSAELFFLLIAPHIPEFMQYKLPDRYRGQKAWFPPKNKTPFKSWLRCQKITSIEVVKEKSHEYDLTTETANYFASGVLVHNSNSRVGIVNLPDLEMGDFDWVFTAGSHDVRRKEFNDKGLISKYWMPLYIRQDLQPTPMMQMLFDIVSEENASSSVIVFGEIFGVGIQDMTYGKNALSYRIFDISVDQNYLDYDKMESYVKRYNELGLELAPVLYRGPYSLAKMDELVDGPTTICAADEIKEVFKGREGIVIRPITERYDPIVGSRTLLKYVSADYHDRRNKNTTEDH